MFCPLLFDRHKHRTRFSFQVSQTIARGGPRSQIAIPAQGMIEFRDALTDLLEEFGTDDGGYKGPFSWLIALYSIMSRRVKERRKREEHLGKCS